MKAARYGIPAAVVAFPLAAFAYAQGGFLETVALVLYGAIGLFGALSVLTLIGGFSLYMVRLGTEHRKEGIKIMEWGVVFLFVDVVLIFILNRII